MKNIILCSMALMLSGCAWWQAQYDKGDGIASIRNQADVDAYNATVSSESEKLVCQRERRIGSNFPQLVCMTVAQRQRISTDGQEFLEEVRRAGLNN